MKNYLLCLIAFVWQRRSLFRASRREPVERARHPRQRLKPQRVRRNERGMEAPALQSEIRLRRRVQRLRRHRLIRVVRLHHSRRRKLPKRKTGMQGT